jgi:hypothetical protein
MPETISLSEHAVALLRFRVKNWHFKVKERDLPAFQELVDAGIMVPDGADFRFTEEGYANREELLGEAADRIERERFEPPDASNLSIAARTLLRNIVTAGRIEITRGNRPLFRELASARIVVLLHTFAKGDESAYLFTYWGFRQRFQLISQDPDSAQYGSEKPSAGRTLKALINRATSLLRALVAGAPPKGVR